MKTDLDKIKEMTKILFDAVPIEPGLMGIVQHPFVEIMQVPVNNEDGGMEIIDISDKKNLEIYRRQQFELIDRAESILRVYMHIRDPWKLTWLKFTKDYMSREDFAEYLADAWVTEENPNDDANVNIRTLISWFKQANKKSLMQEDDYKVWEELPETITVYRGVSIGRVPYGLSWTANIETARFFQHRFESWHSKDGKKGFLQKAVIEKKHALAYFNTRNEDEIVVDVNAIKDRIVRVESEEELN